MGQKRLADPLLLPNGKTAAGRLAAANNAIKNCITKRMAKRSLLPFSIMGAILVVRTAGKWRGVSLFLAEKGGFRLFVENQRKTRGQNRAKMGIVRAIKSRQRKNRAKKHDFFSAPAARVYWTKIELKKNPSF